MDPLDLIMEEKGNNVHVVSRDCSVLAAVEAMSVAHVGALLVMDDSRLAGIFSERDLMRRVVLEQRDPACTPVGDVMTHEVVCVPRDCTPRNAMELLTERRVRHLPVVDGNRIVGIISIGDLVRWTIRDREQQLEEMTDYVTGRYPG